MKKEEKEDIENLIKRYPDSEILSPFKQYLKDDASAERIAKKVTIKMMVTFVAVAVMILVVLYILILGYFSGAASC